MASNPEQQALLIVIVRTTPLIIPAMLIAVELDEPCVKVRGRADFIPFRSMASTARCTTSGGINDAPLNMMGLSGLRSGSSSPASAQANLAATSAI